MVVSVEISGVLEEKLRRLVELGIYASVSEAVRDAVRSLLASIDLRRIAANLYVSKGSSLHYACSFAETTCNAFIDYLLLQGYTPGLGYLEEPPRPSEEARYLLDPSSVHVIYSSTLPKAIDQLGHLDIRVPSVIWNYYGLLRARSLRVNSKPSRVLLTVNVTVRSPPQSMLVTDEEYSIVEHAAETGAVVVTDDFYVQRLAADKGVKWIPSISLLLYAAELGALDPVLYREALMSLDSIPYSYPATLHDRFR